MYPAWVLEPLEPLPLILLLLYTTFYHCRKKQQFNIFNCFNCILIRFNQFYHLADQLLDPVEDNHIPVAIT